MKKTVFLIMLCVAQSFDMQSSSSSSIDSKIISTLNSIPGLSRIVSVASQVIEDRMKDPSNADAIASASLLIGIELVKTASDLDQIRYLKNQPHTVPDAAVYWMIKPKRRAVGSKKS